MACDKNFGKMLHWLVTRITNYLEVKLQWATKVLRHLAIKSIFERLGHICPLSPQTMLIFPFLRLHRPQRLQTLNWGAGGIRELTLDANKLDQLEVLNYRKASFSKSVSTFFVAHCRFGSLQEHSEG